MEDSIYTPVVLKPGATYQVVAKDEAIQRGDLVRELHPLPEALRWFSYDVHAWFVAEDRLSGWIGRSQADLWAFSHEDSSLGVPPYQPKYEILREVRGA